MSGARGAFAYAEAVSVYLAFAISKLTNLGSSVTSWMSDRGALRETFARQGIPMAWDFAEVNFFSDSAGNWLTPIDKISKVVSELPAERIGSICQSSATEAPYPTGVVISTDPPYYDNIEYADLSDFFFVWLRRALMGVDPSLFSILSTPKAEELVATRNRYGTQEAADSFFLGLGPIKRLASPALCDSQFPGGSADESGSFLAHGRAICADRAASAEGYAG